MRGIVLVATLVLAGCASAPKEAATPPPVAEYKVPLLMADGSMSELTVEDGKPGEGVRILFCKELPGVLACLADDNGRQAWLMIPFGDGPPPGDPKKFISFRAGQ